MESQEKMRPMISRAVLLALVCIGGLRGMSVGDALAATAQRRDVMRRVRVEANPGGDEPLTVLVGRRENFSLE